MKKLFVIACAFAAVIGCQKAEIELPDQTEVIKVPLQINASIGSATKTTMTNEAGVLKTAWADGDEVNVSVSQDRVYFKSHTKYTANVSGSSVTFTTETEGGITVPAPTEAVGLNRYQISAEYPSNWTGNYANYRNYSVPDAQVQKEAGDLSHLTQTNVIFAPPTDPEWAEDLSYAVVDLTFQHALSVLQLNLNASEAGVTITKVLVEMLDETGADWLASTGTIDIRSGAITQKSGSNMIELTISSGATLPTDGNSQFYLTISPGHAGQTLKVSVLTDMGKTIEVGTMKVPSDGIPQGVKAVKSFTVQPPQGDDVDYSSAIDLSATGTANTYLVTAPGQLYKFKATVKGNGVVPAALTAANVCTTTAIEPKSALILWYNCLQTSKSWVDQNPVDISTVTLKDGYIYFKTPETFVNGNAVIAAFAESGVSYSSITVDENRLINNATILWSWNIWASNGYDIEADAFKAGDFTIMGRNIGAVIGKTEIDAYTTAAERKYAAASAIGNYYQWGNKNPYPHVSDYENYWVPQYGNKMYVTPTYTPVLALQDSMNGNATMAAQMFGTFDNLVLDVGTYLSADDRTPDKIVALTESAPYKYMRNTTSSYSYSWTGNVGGTALESLWGDPTLEDVSDHVKSVYDPCPVGWKVWEDDAWDAMQTASTGTAVIDLNAMDTSKGGYGSIICGSYFPTNGGGRDATFVVNRLTRCGYAAETAYTVSNPSLYAYGYFGNKYMIAHSVNFELETDIEVKVGTHLSTGYSTPLRCVKE